MSEQEEFEDAIVQILDSCARGAAESFLAGKIYDHEMSYFGALAFERIFGSGIGQILDKMRYLSECGALSNIRMLELIGEDIAKRAHTLITQKQQVD